MKETDIKKLEERLEPTASKVVAVNNYSLISC